MGVEGLLIEVVEEGGDALEGRLALAFNFDFEIDFHFGNAAQILDIVQFCAHSHAATGDYGLSELHFIHAVIHQHRNVVHLNDLLPKIGQHRECEVAVSDGALKWAFLLSALHVDVNPLVVECGVSKLVYALLRYMNVFALAQVGAFESFKVFVGLNRYHNSSFICLSLSFDGKVSEN